MKALSASAPRAIARLAACLLMIAVGVVASLPLPAQAHVLLLRSDPADGSVLKEAPTRAVFEFNQPLAPTAYVILTAVLYQRGSAESKRIGQSEAVDRDPRKSGGRRGAPWP